MSLTVRVRPLLEHPVVQVGSLYTMVGQRAMNPATVQAVMGMVLTSVVMATADVRVRPTSMLAT